MIRILGHLLVMCAGTAYTLSANASSLQPRMLRSTTECTQPIPNDPYSRIYRSVTEDPTQDAKLLIENVHVQWRAFRQSEAYSHYFTAEDERSVRRVYRAIRKTFAERLPQISYHCGSHGDIDCTERKLAYTWEVRGWTRIRLCDKFFDNYSSTSDFRVRHNLISRRANDSPEGWCQQGKSYGFFVVAGATFIAEMAHLDTIGKLARLPQRAIRYNLPYVFSLERFWHNCMILI